MDRSSSQFWFSDVFSSNQDATTCILWYVCDTLTVMTKISVEQMFRLWSGRFRLGIRGNFFLLQDPAYTSSQLPALDATKSRQIKKRRLLESHNPIYRSLSLLLSVTDYVSKYVVVLY